jgi:hypothetical protein
MARTACLLLLASLTLVVSLPLAAAEVHIDMPQGVPGGIGDPVATVDCAMHTAYGSIASGCTDLA